MAKRALITGITGQDGMYLSELLLAKNYVVYGLIRGQHNPKRALVEAELPAVRLIEGDLTDPSSLVHALEVSQPDEIYNLGAWSFVAGSFTQPALTAQITGVGALNLLEAIRAVGLTKKAKFYQASSSELFGKVRETPQNEKTPFYPRSPYGSAKAFAHYTTVNYRESYDLFACAGILFNHESPRRGHEFVTRKITSSVARIKLGLQKEIVLGNLDAKRDWGFAGDYVRGMWLMLQQDKPEDYVLATGKVHSIHDLLTAAFNEVGINDWSKYIRQDPQFMRPAEVDLLQGDSSKARRKLHWKPSVTFNDLIGMMVKRDIGLESQRR